MEIVQIFVSIHRDVKKMALSSLFPSYSACGTIGSMSLSKTLHFVTENVSDEHNTDNSMATAVEQAVINITQEIVRRLVGLEAGGDDQRFENICQTVLTVATQFRERLDQYVSMLCVTDVESTVRSFYAVLDQLNDGQQIHCGRVLTVLAFAGCVAQHCIQKEIILSDDVNQLAELMGRKIAAWFISSQHSLVRILLQPAAF